MPLTRVKSAGVTNNAIGSSQIAPNAVGSSQIDLTANYTFTGTVSGAGDATNIIEKIGGVCDGTTRTTSSGVTFTLPNVTGVQDLTGASNFTNVNGSIVSYTAPSNCIGVLYEFEHCASWNNSTHAIQHYEIYLDSTRINNTRITHAGTKVEAKPMMSWYFRIDSSLGSVNANTGAVPSWSSSKQIKVMSRAYSASAHHIGRMHGGTYWNGSGGGVFYKPQVWITAFKAV